MERISKFVIAALLAVSIAGCTGEAKQSTPKFPTSASSNTTSSIASVSSNGVPQKSEADKILASIEQQPRKGGVNAYVQADGNIIKPEDQYIGSYMVSNYEFTVDVSKGSLLTVVPICKGADAYFVLLLDGKNTAEGPCGGGFFSFFTTPKERVKAGTKISFEVSNSDAYEVAFYQRKE